MRAQPVAAASAASATVATSTVRSSRRAVASANRSAWPSRIAARTSPTTPAEGHGPLGARDAAHQRDHVVGEVAGAELEAHRARP